jgi:hypothetical protein
MTHSLFPVTSLWAKAWRLACIAGLRWALAEIPPTHPDVPYIVRRINELRRKS